MPQQCSPNFDQALERSEWFKGAGDGEVEPQSDLCDIVNGFSFPENRPAETSVKASTPHQGSDKFHDEHNDPTTKPTSQELTRGMPAHSGKQSDASTSEWKDGVTKKTGRSPLSPGLVTRARCAQNNKKPLERYEDMDKVEKVAATSQGVAMSMASGESKPASPKCSGRVTCIRMAPQHFSPLGTSFRDVHVSFLPRNFVIQAVDCEGYAWTAHSSMLPGHLAVDSCKYKIDPHGKDVLITLCAARTDQSWKGLRRLQLFRPYEIEELEQVRGNKSNFI